MRFEGDGPMEEQQQVCWKYNFMEDPVFGTSDRKMLLSRFVALPSRLANPRSITIAEHLLTFVWDSPFVGWPAAHSFGLNSSQGLCRSKDASVL
eukprot:COSAG04_NODE_11924_length_680_cov_1.423408_2_plen_94_part_00